MRIDETLQNVQEALFGYPASRVIRCLNAVKVALSDEGDLSDRSYLTQQPPRTETARHSGTTVVSGQNISLQNEIFSMFVTVCIRANALSGFRVVVYWVLTS